MQNAKRKVIEGFTLIEALVAVTILLIGVLGPMSAATRGITDGLYAQNQLVATHLAQEALDLLSTQIDNNNINRDADLDGDIDSDDFLFGLGSCLDPATCAVILDSSGGSVGFSFPACSEVSNCDLSFDSSVGFYKPYVSGNTAFVGLVFKRTLTVKKLTVTAPIQVLLTVKVDWTNKLTLKSFELSRYGFDKN